MNQKNKEPSGNQLIKWHVSDLKRENDKLREALRTLEKFGGLVGTICRHTLAETRESNDR